jgi:hypothetical protein
MLVESPAFGGLGSPVNSNSQVARNGFAVKVRAADTIRVRCVLPGLLTTETGSSEISDTKYMNSDTGLPGDLPGSGFSWRVGLADSDIGSAPRLSVSGSNGAPASRGAAVKQAISNSQPSMIAVKPGDLELPPTLQASGFAGGC